MARPHVFTLRGVGGGVTVGAGGGGRLLEVRGCWRWVAAVGGRLLVVGGCWLAGLYVALKAAALAAAGGY